jgi:hypothetical protein
VGKKIRKKLTQIKALPGGTKRPPNGDKRKTVRVPWRCPNTAERWVLAFCTGDKGVHPAAKIRSCMCMPLLAYTIDNMNPGYTCQIWAGSKAEIDNVGQTLFECLGMNVADGGEQVH